MACIFLLKPSIIYCSKKNKNRNLFTDFYSDKVCYFFGSFPSPWTILLEKTYFLFFSDLTMKYKKIKKYVFS